MNKLLALTCFALAAAGCTPNPGPIRLDAFFAPSSACSVPKTSDARMIAGSLDVAVGAEFFAGAMLESILNTNSGQSGDLAISSGTILEAAGRDAPVVDSVVISYATKPKLSGFKDHTLALHASFDTTATPIVALMSPFNLIGQDAALALDVIQPSIDPADAVELTATVTFNGYMLRQGNRITSGPNPFPITVTRSAVTCTNAAKRNLGCVYPGQINDIGNYCCACTGGWGSSNCNGTSGSSSPEAGCY